MSKIKKAEKEYEETVKLTHIIEQKKEKFDTADKWPPGRRPHFEKKIKDAKVQEQFAKKKIGAGSLKP
ncbi:MAG: hypothetical protein R6U68_02190 [Desulfobacteraceae bacterium]